MSNHPDCAQIAADEAIAYVHLPVTAATKLQQEQVLRALITQHNVDLVVLSRAVSYLAENRVLLVGKKTVVFP